MSTNPNQLSIREKVGYGLGDTASNIFFFSVNVFIFYFYTDVFGLDPGKAGTLLLATRLWDAISDPLMGTIADRTRTRLGVYRPYLLWMALPAGVAGFLAFANPDLGPDAKLIYAYITYILLMTAYTAINVPYSALMGVMTPDPEQRTSLSTFRFFGAFTGQLIISLGFLPLVDLLGNEDQGVGFPRAMALLAGVATVMFVLTFLNTKERIPPQPAKDANFIRDFGFLIKNRPWVIMVIAAILTLSSAAIRWTVTPHFYKYVVGADNTPYWWFLDKTTFVMTTGTLAFIAGVAFTGLVSRLFGKRNALIGLTILNGLTVIAFFFIPPEAYLTMVVVNAIGNFIAGPTPALVWAIYTDVVDFGEWKFGRRSTGLAFSAAMFAQKFGISIGASLCGWMLAYYGFVADKPQNQDTIDGLWFIFCILPGVIAIANGIVLLWYNLGPDQLKTIATELSERRAETARQLADQEAS